MSKISFMSSNNNFISLVLPILIALFSFTTEAHTATLRGRVTADSNQAVKFAKVFLQGTKIGSKTDTSGKFTIKNIPAGTYKVNVAAIGYDKGEKTISLKENETVELNFELTANSFELDEVVVSGTRTAMRQTESPVIVNVINSETLSNIQACNLSEGLRFQSGLRVETNCQTCNYTQLRMNGLAGGYSQILINGRPIFSPLTGLYGLEQLPVNMIDRIEVVRGGGSTLYGSSAIAGTVNVMTKIPQTNSYSLDYGYNNINGNTNDNIISGNATLVSENNTSGISFFLTNRERGFYDANADNFSEIPLIQNTSIGANMFFLPKENQKLEISISNINEYRFGGEMIKDKPAYLAQQSEERTHNVWMANADYQINFNNENTSLITYLALQNTDRKHYTGIQPDDSVEYNEFVANPPYGTSTVSTLNIGMQINHRVNDFLSGNNVFTLGTEYLFDDVLDIIPTYQYLIDQTTKDFGVFLQSDWEIIPQLTLLSGVRMDKHNLVDNLIFSPRASLLYKLENHTQFRFSYGTGFRAPQAFDTDLHIAFAAGGVSRVSLSPDLIPERSQSFSGSINYDKLMENWIAGFTIEAFHNRLNNAFFLQPIGQDQFGELFEKQNGDGATVQGITVELRANYNQKIQLESGFTLQSSKFDNPVQYIDGLEGIREFVRTPNDYGYAILTLTPNDEWSATINYLYTGTMKVPHFAGAPNQTIDEIFTSDAFSELGTKVGYTIPIENLANGIEIYGGVRNIFNAFQRSFDIGKNRDSNFMYGPAQPRTFFIGIKLKSL
jgi:outer membrane receptor for ferrienterochelin and colicins